MQILDPGHHYIADCYDGEIIQPVQFMKRIGESYPGNEGYAYPGTNCQELIRILVDRVKYLEGQIPSKHDMKILYHLREALISFEERAAVRHSLILPLDQSLASEPESLPTCKKCGHIVCPHGVKV